jgi:hypothetical protein
MVRKRPIGAAFRAIAGTGCDNAGALVAVNRA